MTAGSNVVSVFFVLLPLVMCPQPAAGCAGCPQVVEVCQQLAVLVLQLGAWWRVPLGLATISGALSVGSPGDLHLPVVPLGGPPVV